MKQLLVIAIALASTNAFATRARVNALGNSPHLIDTQTVYSNPADMFFVGGDYVTMESGSNAVPSGAKETNAEGMIVKSMGDGKFGLSLGHQSENASIWGLRAGTGFATIKSQQNPLELSYGMKAGETTWAATLVYSNYNDKTATAEKETSTGIRAGMRMGALDARLGLGLVNTYENATDGKYKGTMGLSLGAGYSMDNLYVFGDVKLVGYKTENPAGAETNKLDQTTITVGALSSHKKDGNEFFYGASLSNVNTKNDKTSSSADDQKVTTMTLPVWMGLEVEANSWLALRGSIKQSVLIQSSKTEVGGATVAETSPGLNSTVAAIGAGLKFNKITIDGTLEGLTGGTATQQLNGNSLLATVGATYMF